jgi:hypothetical protein
MYLLTVVNVSISQLSEITLFNSTSPALWVGLPCEGPKGHGSGFKAGSRDVCHDVLCHMMLSCIKPLKNLHTSRKCCGQADSPVVGFEYERLSFGTMLKPNYP